MIDNADDDDGKDSVKVTNKGNNDK